jgi:hypothetical protein
VGTVLRPKDTGAAIAAKRKLARPVATTLYLLAELHICTPTIMHLGWLSRQISRLSPFAEQAREPKMEFW